MTKTIFEGFLESRADAVDAVDAVEDAIVLADLHDILGDLGCIVPIEGDNKLIGWTIMGCVSLSKDDLPVDASDNGDQSCSREHRRSILTTIRDAYNAGCSKIIEGLEEDEVPAKIESSWITEKPSPIWLTAVTARLGGKDAPKRLQVDHVERTIDIIVAGRLPIERDFDGTYNGWFGWIVGTQRLSIGDIWGVSEKWFHDKVESIVASQLRKAAA